MDLGLAFEGDGLDRWPALRALLVLRLYTIEGPLCGVFTPCTINRVAPVSSPD